MRNGTYSIVARDPETGELGVAVQSHWFAVGDVVSWARPGVGAVATQSVAEKAHGPNGLDRLDAGRSATEALADLLETDPQARFRQVAIVDAAGGIAVHTGDGCMAYAGDEAGEAFSCQANMMERDTVPGAMAAAYRAAEGYLAERLLAALDAAQAEGGDVRGQQSAALLVVPAAGEAWETRIDVRVDDHPDPLRELRRLVTLARAYEYAEQGDELLGEGRHDEATEAYRRAAELAPDADELIFWAGLGLAATDLEAGVAQVREAIAVKPAWRVLLDRLEPEIAPTAEAVRRELDA
jgi:uncharacterized Ntn-hydrolase superfamily protein